MFLIIVPLISDFKQNINEKTPLYWGFSVPFLQEFITVIKVVT
jgi:hypothetical protein